MFPFVNQLQTFDITGQELINMFKIVQVGKKAFYQAWNLQITVTYDKATDKKGFVGVKFVNGT